MKSLLLVLLLSWSGFAQASLLVEPFIGVARPEIDSVAGRENGYGTALGARLAYQDFGFQLGLDIASLTSRVGGGYGSDMRSTQYAAFVGFRFPVLFHVYGGYILKADGDTSLNNGSTCKFSDGKGYLLGVGFSGMPFIDVNLEYRNLNYATTKLNGADAGRGSDYTAYVLSLSLPLNF